LVGVVVDSNRLEFVPVVKAVLAYFPSVAGCKDLAVGIGEALVVL
jgi:hypothetical protein